MILIVGGGRLAKRIRGKDPEIFIASHQHLNVCNGRDVQEYLSRAAMAGVTVVINCAANTSVGAVELDRASGTNSVGPGLIALACETYGLKLIQISTDYVFGGGVVGPYTASDRPFPVQHYGRSKLLGEWATAFCGNTVIVRIGWIFGPEYPRNAVMLAATAVKRYSEWSDKGSREPLNFDIWSDIVGTPTHVAEAARVIRRMAKARVHWVDADLGIPKIVHVSSGEAPISWYDFLKESFPLITPGSAPPDLRRPRVGGLVPTMWGVTEPYKVMLEQFKAEIWQSLKLPALTNT